MKPLLSANICQTYFTSLDICEKRIFEYANKAWSFSHPWEDQKNLGTKIIPLYKNKIYVAKSHTWSAVNGVAYMAVNKNDSLALKKNLLNQTGHEIWG